MSNSLHKPAAPKPPTLPTEPDEPDVEQPIYARLGFKPNLNQTDLSLLIEADGNEDLGAELDTEFTQHK